MIRQAVVIALAAMLVLPATAQILHVDPDAPGPVHDGSTWCTAYLSLSDALAAAGPGAEIRLAQGTHAPDPAGLADPRDATFALQSGQHWRGGFAGCGEPDPDAWDPDTWTTILSGGLGAAGAAYHVVSADGVSELAIVSGLRIEGGRADGREGGGLRSMSSRVRLSRCTLAGNQAWRGAAIYAEGGDVDLLHCRLEQNHATGEGGAVFHATAALLARDCLLAGNSAQSDGGAVFSDLVSARFLGCTMADNHSQGRGGAVYDYVGVETHVINSVVWGNTDQLGQGEESQLFINPSNLLQVDHSCVQGWTGAFGGTGNLGDDPQFVDPSGDLHLIATSPCLNVGDNLSVETQVDLDGRPRILDDVVDLGCYEGGVVTAVPSDPRSAARIVSVTRAGGHVVRFVPPAGRAWSLDVFDLRGRRVARLATGAGDAAERTRSWHGADATGRRVAQGVYLVTLRSADGMLDTRKLVRVD